MAYNHPFGLDLGPAYTGLAGSITLAVVDQTNTPIAGITLGGVTELPAGSGFYSCLASSIPVGQEGYGRWSVAGYPALRAYESLPETTVGGGGITTYSRPFGLDLGLSTSGIAGSITLALVDSTNTPIPGITLGGVSELPAASGFYTCTASGIPIAQEGYAHWTVTGLPALRAYESIPETVIGTGGGGGVVTIPPVTTTLVVASGIGATATSVVTIPGTAALSLLRGMDYTLTAVVLGAQGVGVNLTGSVVQFLIKTNATDPDSAALYTRNNVSAGGIVLSAPTSGILTLTLAHSDFISTTTFPENAALNWGMKLFSAAGQETFLMGGSVHVTTPTVSAITTPT